MIDNFVPGDRVLFRAWSWTDWEAGIFTAKTKHRAIVVGEDGGLYDVPFDRERLREYEPPARPIVRDDWPTLF